MLGVFEGREGGNELWGNGLRRHADKLADPGLRGRAQGGKVSGEGSKGSGGGLRECCWERRSGGMGWGGERRSKSSLGTRTNSQSPACVRGRGKGVWLGIGVREGAERGKWGGKCCGEKVKRAEVKGRGGSSSASARGQTPGARPACAEGERVSG
jgi:hypothetical protein